MSMGGCYISISEDKLNEILDNGESLSDFVFDDNNKDQLTFYSLEQAWDAIRVLLDPVVDDVLGYNVLEDVDLGECAYIIKNDELNNMLKELGLVTEEKFSELFNSSSFHNTEFYWDETWRDEENMDELKDMVMGLSKFIKETLEKKHILLFYIC